MIFVSCLWRQGDPSQCIYSDIASCRKVVNDAWGNLNNNDPNWTWGHSSFLIQTLWALYSSKSRTTCQWCEISAGGPWHLWRRARPRSESRISQFFPMWREASGFRLGKRSSPGHGVSPNTTDAKNNTWWGKYPYTMSVYPSLIIGRYSSVCAYYVDPPNFKVYTNSTVTRTSESDKAAFKGFSCCSVHSSS